jgi:hypothetical protein
MHTRRQGCGLGLSNIFKQSASKAAEIRGLDDVTIYECQVGPGLRKQIGEFTPDSTNTHHQHLSTA